MPFQSRVFKLAKDADHPQQDEDAYGIDAARGIASVADGVASAIFSRQWARILAEAAVAETPDPNEKESFGRWLAQRRQAWSQQIDVTGLAWFQKAKLPMGAFSTLLWVRVLPTEEDCPGQFGAYRLHCCAIGDSCLFHVRNGELVRTFPIQKAAELEVDPIVLGSVDLRRDQLMEFVTLDEVCYPDDLLVLCTDAIAQWVLQRIESGDPPAWDDYWNLTESQWQEEIAQRRQRQEMRYDDATLLLLRVTAGDVQTGQPENRPVTVEVVPEAEAAAADEEPTVSEEDWKGKFKSAGTHLAEGIELASEQAVRGWRKWKAKAIRTFREKFKGGKK